MCAPRRAAWRPLRHFFAMCAPVGPRVAAVMSHAFAWQDMWRHPHGDGHPNGAMRPAMQLMRAWRTAMRPSLLPRGGPLLGGFSVALPATSITSQPHFSLLTIFSLSPFPIPLVIPSLCPRVRFQLGRVKSSGFGLDFAPRTEFS